MTTKFLLEIELGNAEMLTKIHLASALKKVSEHFRSTYIGPVKPDDGAIRDVNGNTVGRWEVYEDVRSGAREWLLAREYNIDHLDDMIPTLLKAADEETIETIARMQGWKPGAKATL